MAGVFNSNILSMGSAFLLSILLTRTLGPEGYGLFSALVIIPLIVVSITQMGVRGASIYLLGQKKYDEQAIVSSMLALLAFTSLAGIVFSSIAYFIYSEPGFTVLLVALVVPVIPLRLAVIYIGGIFMGRDEIRKANQLNWPINLLNLALAAVLVWGLGMQVLGAVIAGLLANLAVSIYTFWLLAKDFKLSFRYSKEILVRLLKMGILYSLSFFIIQLNYRVDIILLENLTDLKEVGLYSLAVGLAEQLWQVPHAVSLIIFARTAGAQDLTLVTAQTLRLTRLSFLLALALSGFLMLLAPWLVPLIFGQEFSQSILMLQIIIPGIVFLVIYRVLSGQMAGMGKPQVSIYIFAPALLLNVLLNYLLIPEYGGAGAALASNFSYFLGAAGYWFIFARMNGLKYTEILKFRRDDFSPVLQLIKGPMALWKK